MVAGRTVRQPMALLQYHSTNIRHGYPPTPSTSHHSANLQLYDPDTKIVSEWQLFNIFDKLLTTATGMDNLSVWFLRIHVGDPSFINHLLTYSINHWLHPQFHASRRMPQSDQCQKSLSH